MTDDLPAHILAARQFLPPEKARVFEESYRRMRSRARDWDAGVLREELKAALDSTGENRPA